MYSLRANYYWRTLVTNGMGPQPKRLPILDEAQLSDLFPFKLRASYASRGSKLNASSNCRFQPLQIVVFRFSDDTIEAQS